MALSFEDSINPKLTLLLNDPEVKWNKATRVLWLNDGIKKIFYMRGDAMLSDWDEIEYEDYSITDPKDLIIPDLYEQEVINYVIWKCYLSDSQDEFNMNLASSWEQTFRRGMRSDG